MTEFRPALCIDAGQQGLLACLLKRLKVKSFFLCSKKKKFLFSSRSKRRSVRFDCIRPKSCRFYCRRTMKIVKFSANSKESTFFYNYWRFVQRNSNSNIDRISFRRTNVTIHNRVKNSNTWRIYSVVSVHR